MTLKDFMPDYYKDNYDFNLICDVDDYLFSLLGNVFKEFIDNQYIATSDVQRIMIYERILDIVPDPEESLDSRRQRVQTEWNNNNPYSLNYFLRILQTIHERRVFTWSYEDLYKLKLVISLGQKGQVEIVEDLIDVLVPLNIEVDMENKLIFDGAGSYRTGGATVYTAKQILTQDFEKVLDAVGAINKGSSSSIASVIEIKEEQING